MALVTLSVFESPDGFTVSLIEDDVAHTWVAIAVVNQCGYSIDVFCTVAGQDIGTTTFPPGNVTQQTFAQPIVLAQKLNAKAEMTWQPTVEFSISVAPTPVAVKGA